MISTRKNAVRAAIALTVFAGLIGLNSLKANEIDEENLLSAAGAEFFAGSTYSGAPSDAAGSGKEKKEKKKKENPEKGKKDKSGKPKSESSDMGTKDKGKKGEDEDEGDDSDDEFFNWNRGSTGKPGH